MDVYNVFFVSFFFVKQCEDPERAFIQTSAVRVKSLAKTSCKANVRKLNIEAEW